MERKVMKMGMFRRSRLGLVALGLIGSFLITSLVLPVHAQKGYYSDVRALVGRTQTDLRQVLELVRRNGKELQRIEFAQRHLSQFDRALSKRKWDKEKLDAAIDDLQNVVDHNTLEPEDRDRLMADLRDLRELRRERDK